MAIPNHTHNFSLLTATKQDVEAGASTSLVVVPASLGSAATRDVGYFATSMQGAKADSAIQPSDIGNLAKKDKVTVADIEANGSPSFRTFLAGSGEWINVEAGGDMRASIYDPNNIAKDAFSMGNMVETDTAKIFKDTDKHQLFTNSVDIDKNAEAITAITKQLDEVTKTLSKIDLLALIPVGTTIYYDSDQPPKGFLVRDGAILKIKDYPELFKLLGTRYGGDGRSTFGVGDYRGYFIRGYGDGQKVDQGRTLGSEQGDAARTIWGNFWVYRWWTNEPDGVFRTGSLNRGQNIAGAYSDSLAHPITGFNSSWQNPSADENRPINISQLVCIKAN